MTVWPLTAIITLPAGGTKWWVVTTQLGTMMQLLQSSLIRIIFTNSDRLQTMEHLESDVSRMSSAPQTFICLLYSESEGVLLLQVMLFSYQGVLLHCTVRAIVSEMFVIGGQK